jgi:hypothetical protein
MCEFVSWIEYEGKEYFLTNADLDTKAGAKLLLAEVKDDLCGHGAIKAYYPELKNRGANKECSDFSTPANFPKSIVKAIKEGRLSRIDVCLDVLNDKGKKQYEKVRGPAWAEYEKVRGLAFGKIVKQAKYRTSKWR